MKEIRYINNGEVNWNIYGMGLNVIEFDSPVIINQCPNKHMVLIGGQEARFEKVAYLKEYPDEVDFTRIYSHTTWGPLFWAKGAGMGFQFKGFGNMRSFMASVVKVLRRHDIDAYTVGNRNDIFVIYNNNQVKLIGWTNVMNGISCVMCLEWNPELAKKYIKAWKPTSTSGWNVRGIMDLAKEPFDLIKEVSEQVASDNEMELVDGKLTEKEKDRLEKLKPYLLSEDWIFKGIKNW